MLLWLEKNSDMPPVGLTDLVARVIENAWIEEWILELVEKKRYALERENQPAAESLMDWIQTECRRLAENPPVLDYARKCGEMDAIFRVVLGEF